MEKSLAWWLVLCATLNLFIDKCDGASILFVLSNPSLSQTIAYGALPKALSSRGHQVTVVTSHHLLTPGTDTNTSVIVVPPKWFGTDVYLKAIVKKKRDETITMTDNSAVERCKHFLSDKNVQKLIHNKKIKFDLVITEFIGHECFLGFVQKYKAILIGLHKNNDANWINNIEGSTSAYSSLLHKFGLSMEKWPLEERIKHYIASFFFTDSYQNEQLQYSKVTKEYFKGLGSLPPSLELERRFAFLFYNSEVILNNPGSQLPNVIEIGGMHIKPTYQKLPQDLQDLLDGAKHGVIVFYLGINLGEYITDERKLEHFIEAFSRMKQVILWKRIEKTPRLPKNIHLRHWLPLADVLAHPKVRLFVTHGGLLSLQEAAYHGVPVVGIPICDDQFFNIKRVEELRFGIRLNYDNITSKSLTVAVTKVLSQNSYRKNAKLVSSKFLDQLTPPLKKAVFWTEYALRHQGATHLHSVSLQLTWFQYYSVDVVVLLVVGSIVLVYLLYKGCRKVFGFLFGPAWSDKKIFVPEKREKMN